MRSLSRQQSRARLTLLHVVESLAPDLKAYDKAQDLRMKLEALVPAEALNSRDIDVDIVSGVPRDAIVVDRRSP